VTEERPNIRENERGKILQRLAAVALLSSTVSCTDATAPPPSDPATTVAAIDDARTGPGFERFRYEGRWERVRGRHDGRDAGTSTRSPYAGNIFGLGFIGYRFRIYGVAGPNGGRGMLALDGRSNAATLNFFTPRKRTHVLLYTSPILEQGIHRVSVTVDRTRDPRSHGTYVNVDSMQVDSY
jgi:hypothetical protein